jgi:hypothetical protein
MTTRRLSSSSPLRWAALLGMLSSCYSQWDEESKQPPPYRIDPTPACSLNAPIPNFTCPRSSLPGIGLIPGCCNFADDKCGVDTSAFGGGCVGFDSAEYQAVYPHANPPVHCNGAALDGWESVCRAALRASSSNGSSDAGVAKDGGSRTLDGGKDGGTR